MKKLLNICVLTSMTFLVLSTATRAGIVINALSYSTTAKVDRVEKFIINNQEQTLLSKATVEASMKTEDTVTFATREAATAYLSGLCKTKISAWTSFLVYNYGGAVTKIDPEMYSWVKAINFAETAEEISATTRVDDDTYNTHMWADCKTNEVRFNAK